uniref:Mediator of RNA polymerase II transcription subunit 11 n=1 Tax=Parascaris equorum TaxID=6256 RepID=A0A914RRI5_PAREQ
MTGSELLRRLNAINEIDQRIGDLMKHAQTCIAELSKEKQGRYRKHWGFFHRPPLHICIIFCHISKSKMEEASSAFKRALNAIESELSAQMQYLSHVCVGTPHQGSTFASQQNVTLAEETILALSD